MIQSGGTPAKANPSYWQGDIPWVSPKDMHSSQIDDTQDHISEVAILDSAARVVERGAILIVVRSGILVHTVPVAFANTKVSFNQDIKAISPDSDVLDPWYLLFALKQKQDYILARGIKRGPTVHSLMSGFLENLLIPLPPLTEQRHIVTILAAWERASNLAAQLIAAKQESKRGLVQLLTTGRQRFSSFHQPWQVVKVSECLSESRMSGSDGRTARKITVRLYGRGVVPKEERSIGSEATKYYQRRAGQFIYSKLDFLNGAFGIVPQEMDGYESTLDLPCFDFKDAIVPEFFLSYVSRESFYSRFAALAVGGRKARRIQVEEFLSSEVKVPGIAEQHHIADFLAKCDQELSLLDTKLDLLKRQKQGLMHLLLTGKVRVTA